MNILQGVGNFFVQNAFELAIKVVVPFIALHFIKKPLDGAAEEAAKKTRATVDGIHNDIIRSLADHAVQYVEQTLPKEPSDMKFKAASEVFKKEVTDKLPASSLASKILNDETVKMVIESSVYRLSGGLSKSSKKDS